MCEMVKLLNIQEASEFIGLSVSTIYEYIRKRRIPFLKIGKRVFFHPDLLEDWLRKKIVKPTE